MLRTAAVADRFYPGDQQSLQEMLKTMVPDAETARPALAVVMPHAGYLFSGPVAGATVATAQIPPEVIILGPNHHGLGAGAAVMDQGAWEMPWGTVPINASLAASVLAHCPDFQADELAHRREHSLEVLVPFLHYRQPELEIVPVCLARSDYQFCQRAGAGLAAAIKAWPRPVLLAASTDMSHFESRQAATTKDNLAIERIQDLDPAGLYQTVAEQRISMCGVIPTVISLIAALQLGARQAELIRYSDSGEASGDTAQVVGYAGLVIS